MSGAFFGMYRGTVVSNVDPEKRGRLLVQVPQVLGMATTNWALPCWPAGWNRSLMHDHQFVDKNDGYQSSGNVNKVLKHKLLLAVPGAGASIWVMFEGGDTAQPVWMGMGTTSQIADALLGTDSTFGGGELGDGDVYGDGTLGPTAAPRWSGGTLSAPVAADTGGGGSTTVTHEHAEYATTTSLAAYATLAQAQTFTGAKTFSLAPLVPDASWTIAKTTGLQAALDSKYSSANPAPATDLSDYATLSTAQTVAGTKTFSSPIHYLTHPARVTMSADGDRGTLTVRNQVFPPVAGQINGRIFGQANDSVGNNTTYSEIRFNATDATDVAEFGAIRFYTANNGANLLETLTLDPGSTAVGLGANVYVKSVTAATKGMVVRAAAGQTANMVEWQDSAGAVTSRVSATGNIVSPVMAAGGFVTTNSVLTAKSFGTALVGLVVQGGTGQTANLQEWQNASNTVLSKVDAAGTLHTGFISQLGGVFMDTNAYFSGGWRPVPSRLSCPSRPTSSAYEAGTHPLRPTRRSRERLSGSLLTPRAPSSCPEQAGSGLVSSTTESGCRSKASAQRPTPSTPTSRTSTARP